MSAAKSNILATWASALFSAALFALMPVLPPLGLMAAIASPLPLALMTHRGPVWMGALSALIAAAILGVGFEPAFAAEYIVPFGIGGVLIGIGVRRNLAPQYVVGAFALLSTGAFAALLAYNASAEGLSVFAYADKMAEVWTEPLKAVLNSGEKVDPQTLMATQAWLENVQHLLARTPIGIVAGFSTVAGWLNAMWLRQNIQRRGFVLTPWTQWRVPDWWVWGLIIAGGLTATGEGVYATVGLNFLIPLGVVYFLQGIAIMEYLLETRMVSRFVRGLLYLLVFMQMELSSPVLALAGAFDQWIDWRARLSPPAEGAGEDKT